MATYLQTYMQATNAGDLDQRAAIAVAKYAAYILGGGSQDSTLIAWAKNAVKVPLSVAQAMRFAVIMDPNYANATADSAAGDLALQSIVEAAVNNTFKNG